jgi:hypothetical protein
MNRHVIQSVPMVLGLDGVDIPGRCYNVCVSIHPQRLFRADRLYFDCDGLIIEWAEVGNCPQPLTKAPTSYYREVDEETKMKGRPFRFDTAEVGNLITFCFSNPTGSVITVSGCLEGVTIR